MKKDANAKTLGFFEKNKLSSDAAQKIKGGDDAIVTEEDIID